MNTARTETVVLLALALCGFCGLGGCPSVPTVPGVSVLPISPSPLAGTWNGTLNYHLVAAYPDGPPVAVDFTMSYAVTFNEAGDADTIGLPTGGGFHPMSGFSAPGDFYQFEIDYAGNTVTYTITVRDVSRTPNSYSITLDIDYSCTGVVEYTMTGTETVSYSLLADGSLEVYFSMEITGDFDGEAVSHTATLTGTLTKQ